jgi:hypothetical protein
MNEIPRFIKVIADGMVEYVSFATISKVRIIGPDHAAIFVVDQQEGYVIKGEEEIRVLHDLMERFVLISFTIEHLP